MPRKVMLAIVLFVVYAQLHSQNALDFKMTDLDNNEWHLFNELYKGKTVVLDFFFTDCIPCQTLTPQVVAMYNDYGNDTGQVLIFGISDRDTDARLKTFEFDYGVKYPSCGTIRCDSRTFVLAILSNDIEIQWSLLAESGKGNSKPVFRRQNAAMWQH